MTKKPSKLSPSAAKLKAERARAAAIVQRLEESIPDPETALAHDNPFQLLIATILSAQCTDVRVNQVTPVLFAQFPGPEDIAQADPENLREIIRSTGFYQNKTKNIIGCAKKLIEAFGGKVPSTIDALVTLPGVGRKTANVVLGSAFGQEAIVVDTHVRRVANRLKLTRSSDPAKIEADLAQVFPKKKWTSGAHRILLHGRYVCKARKPLCQGCTLYDLCPAEKEKKAAK